MSFTYSLYSFLCHILYIYIFRCCRSDGVILKPQYPIRAVDGQIIKVYNNCNMSFLHNYWQYVRKSWFSFKDVKVYTLFNGLKCLQEPYMSYIIFQMFVNNERYFTIMELIYYCFMLPGRFTWYWRARWRSLDFIYRYWRSQIFKPVSTESCFPVYNVSSRYWYIWSCKS